MILFVISQYEVSRLSNTNCVKVSSERRSSSTLYDQYFYPISTRCSSNLKPSIFMVHSQGHVRVDPGRLERPPPILTGPEEASDLFEVLNDPLPCFLLFFAAESWIGIPK